MPQLPSNLPDHPHSFAANHSMSRPLSEPLPTLTPPFDYLLRLLSTPPVLPAFDPLLAAVHFAHQHRLILLYPSFLQQLSRPLLLLHPRPVESRCHLFLLPLHVQRCILTFLSTSCAPHAVTHASLLSLLHLHSTQCHQHLAELTTYGGGGGKHSAVSAEEQSLLTSEYRLILLLHQRLYQQLRQPLPPHIFSQSMGDGVERLLAQLSAHPTWQRSTAEGWGEDVEDESIAAADVGLALPTAHPLPQPSALSVLMRKLCEREGLEWDDGLQLPSLQPPSPLNAVEDTWWMSSWAEGAVDSTASSAAVHPALLDFDDSVFASAFDDSTAALGQEGSEQPAMEEEAVGHSTETNPPLPPSSPPSPRPQAPALVPSPLAPLPHPQPPAVAMQPDERAIVEAGTSTMQSLLSAVMALQFHLADLQAPLSGQLSDAQLRAHRSLLPLIPHVDALHALPSAAFATALTPSSDPSALIPSSLPTKLLYLLIRLLLTASVPHERASLLIYHCMSHVLRGDAHRDVLLAVSHGLGTHPAAVFAALLHPLVSQQGVGALTSPQLDLIRHCVKSSGAARADLTQALLGRLCESLVGNAGGGVSAGAPVPTVWAMEVLQLLVEAVPVVGELGEAVVGVVVVGGRGGMYATLDAGMQSKYGRLMKAVVGKWPEECRRRKAELVSVCQVMSHFTVKKSVERLMVL